MAGLARELTISVALGVGPATDAFRFAMRIPNVLQNLLGEGAMSASFIPVYARLLTKGEKGEADRLAGAIFAMLTGLTVALVGVSVLIAEPFVALFTSWENAPEVFDLAVKLLRITSVGIGFLVLSAWCLGILNSHRSFFLPYAAPVVWNGVQIIVLLLVLAAPKEDIAVSVAWAVVAGGILQFLIQMPRVLQLAPGLRLTLQQSQHTRDVLRRFVPAVGARGVVQISSFADSIMAAALAFGATALYGYTLPLYLLPVSLFGFSVAASELAELSRRESNQDIIVERVQPALRRVLIPGVLVATAYLAAGEAVVQTVYGLPDLLFGRGLQGDDIKAVSLVLMAFAFGLPATMTARITQNTLYSMGDVKGPARIAVIRVVTSFSISLIAMLPLDWYFVADGIVQGEWGGWTRLPESIRLLNDGPPRLGVVGLGIGASVAAWLEWYLLRRLLTKRLNTAIKSEIFVRLTVAAATAGLSMAVVARLGLPFPLNALLVGVVGLGVYGLQLASKL